MKKLNKGFTIIELLVVIAMTGVLATAMSPKIFKEIRKATVATVQHNLGVIRSRLSLDETLSDEFPDLVNGNTNLLKSYTIGFTPGFTNNDGESYPETNEIFDKRNNQGGWFYDRTVGEIYANLPDGAYTKDDEYEVWNENNQAVVNSFSYDFTDIDDFTAVAVEDMEGWSTVGYGQAITANPYDEYTIESKVTFTGDTAGYGIYIQSDKDTNGYVFQFDKGYGNGELIIRERLMRDNGTLNENVDTNSLAKTSDNAFMTDKWWESEHDIQINVTNNNSDSSKQNVEILVDDKVITSNYQIAKSDSDNYTGFRTWNDRNTVVDIDSVNISEL